MQDIADFLVIGGGSAGYAAARTAAGLGLSTVVVEGGDEVGGLCILRGCMPSKAIIESANRYITLRRAGEFGLRAENLRVLPEEIRDRKRRLIAEFAGYREEQLQSGRFEFVRGRAQFAGSDRVLVHTREGAGREIRFRSALVSTGSVIQTLDLPGLEETGYLTSDAVLDSARLPESVIVLGGGPVALEMAHYFAGLGARVTVIQRSEQVLKELDRDVADALTDAFRKRGIDVYTGTRLVRAESSGGRKRIVFMHGGSEVAVEAEEILQALGRRPATDRLGTDIAGIALGRGAIAVDAHLASTVPGIYAAGDASGPFEVVHIAIQQGEIAARNAARFLGRLGGGMESMDYRLRLFAVFTEPQVAIVGMGEKEAGDKEVIAATYPFHDHGKSMVMGETEGFVKLVADRVSGEILGGAVVGPHASDLIHEVVVAMHFRATASQFAAVPHYHPTLSEIWTYPAEDLAERVGRNHAESDVAGLLPS